MITQCPKTGRTCEVTGCAGCWKDSTTQDEIIRMARVAISDTINQHDQMLKRLWCIAYEEGQKAEREACAKVCEEGTAFIQFQSTDCYSYAYNRAAAIRARSQIRGKNDN